MNVMSQVDPANFYPSELIFNYNYYSDKQEHNWVRNTDHAVGFPLLKISIDGDVNQYEYLSNFAHQKNIMIFDKLEYLEIDMGWTSNPEYTLDIFKELLKKTIKTEKNSKLKGFSLKLNRMHRQAYLPVDKRNKARHTFWDVLRKSNVKDVEFRVPKKGDSIRETDPDSSNVQFILHMFDSQKAFLENLSRIKMTFLCSHDTSLFLRKSVENSLHTLKEINLELDYIVIEHKYVASGQLLLNELSKCKVLEKLIINLPAIRYIRYPADSVVQQVLLALDRITKMVIDSERDIFFGLTTNIGFLQTYAAFTNAFDDVLKKVPFKYIKLFVKFVKIERTNYPIEMEKVLNNCPKLEILKIVYDFEADAEAIKYFFKWPKKLNKLNQFSISYLQPESGDTNIYRELLDLIQISSSIVKITVKVESKEYQDMVNVIDRDASKTENEKKNEIDKLQRRYVHAYILKGSATENLKDLFPTFKFSSKLVNPGGVSVYGFHVLILEKEQVREVPQITEEE